MTGLGSIEALYDHCRHNFCIHRFARNFRFVPCTVYLNRLNFCESRCFPFLCICVPCKLVFNIVYCCQYMSIIHIRIILLCVIYTEHGYCADVFFTIKTYVSDLIAIRNVYIILFCLMTGIGSIEALYDHCRHNLCIHRFTRNFRFLFCPVCFYHNLGSCTGSICYCRSSSEFLIIKIPSVKIIILTCRKIITT